MRRPRRKSSIVLALYLNAVLLACILVVMLSRSGASVPEFLPAAWAQDRGPAPVPIAGGAGIYLMPAQFSSNMWGCYVIDVDAQTLAAYAFTGGDRTLRLVAARNIRFDRRLNHFNTEPAPAEIQALVEKEAQQMRGAAGVNE
jgi:hypothetical protein